MIKIATINFIYIFNKLNKKKEKKNILKKL